MPLVCKSAVSNLQANEHPISELDLEIQAFSNAFKNKPGGRVKSGVQDGQQLECEQGLHSCIFGILSALFVVRTHSFVRFIESEPFPIRRGNILCEIFIAYPQPGHSSILMLQLHEQCEVTSGTIREIRRRQRHHHDQCAA